MTSSVQFDTNGNLRHFLTIEGLSREALVEILDAAESFISIGERQIRKVPILRGRTLVNLFFEDSTRTLTTFEIAAKGAFRQSMPKAGPQILEPVMKVDVFSPEDNVGDVIGDLNRRRGMIKDQEAGATGVRIKADVPLSEMFGYIGHLRTITSGRGQFSMEFSHYSACPQNVADKVIEEAKARKAAK